MSPSTPLNLCRRAAAVVGEETLFTQSLTVRRMDDERRVEWKEGEREGKSQKKQEEARLISLHIPATDTYRVFETDWM